MSEYAPEIFEASLCKLRALGLVFEDRDHIVSLALWRADVAPRVDWWGNYRKRWKRARVASG